ncbi:MAG: hypothetical protein ACI9VM_000213 [Candidatus Azotimanducaceae bacterium]|jgi:hypothetical protein
MSDLSFAIHILASMTAIAASYGLLMAILKKKVKSVTVRGVSVLALLASGVSFGLSYVHLLGGSDVVYTLSILFLLLGLGNALAVVIIHRFKLPLDGSYPAHFVSIVRALGIVMFASFTLHFLLELAALSRL